MPLFDKLDLEVYEDGWRECGDLVLNECNVYRAEAEFLVDSLDAQEVGSALIFAVNRWPSQSEVKELLKFMHLGRDVTSWTVGWFDVESKFSIGTGPITMWDGEKYSSGMFRHILCPNNDYLVRFFAAQRSVSIGCFLFCITASMALWS